MRFLFSAWVAICLFVASPAEAKVLLTFEGDVSFKDKNLRAALRFPFLSPAVAADPSSNQSPTEVINGQAIEIQVSQENPESYQVQFNIDHLTLPVFDISSEISSGLKLENVNGQEFWAGEISSQYTLVDFQPIRELHGKYRIIDNKLVVDSLKLGNVLYSGSVQLTRPYIVDLALELEAVDLNDFLDVWVSERQYDSSGNVSGTIKVSGSFQDLYLKGSLSSFGGVIKKLSYDSIYLNVEGIYPQMQVANSKVSEKSGMSFAVDGPINLQDRENFMKQIKALSVSPIITDSDTKREWTIHRAEEGGATATEFKYMIKKGDVSNTGAEGSGMLGVEKKLEF